MDESVYSTEKISTGLAVSLETDQSSTRQFTILIRYLGAFDSLQEIAVFPIVPLLNHFAVGTASKEKILRLTYMPEVLYIDLTRQMEYEQAVQAENRIAACFPMYDEQESVLRGNGILIGIVDSGLEFTHPALIAQDGKSRIIAYWDQSQTGIPPEPYGFGTEYSANQIQSVVSEGTDRRYDTSGHGTAVASILTAFSTGASLIGVAARPNTAAFLCAVDYIVRYAMQQRLPLVLNLSYGNNYGDHYGNSIVEQYLDALRANGKLTIVTGMGNEGNTGRHRYIGGNTAQTVGILVGDGLLTFSLQLWFAPATAFLFRIQAPAGQATTYIPSQNAGEFYSFVLTTTQISIQIGQATPFNPRREIFIVFRGTVIPYGYWSLSIQPYFDQPYQIDAWLPVASSTQATVEFEVPTTDLSLTIPASASNVISVGAYNGARLSVAPFSGKGSVAIQKPDLVAPGVDILAANASGGYRLVSGVCCLCRSQSDAMGHYRWKRFFPVRCAGKSLSDQRSTRLTWQQTDSKSFRGLGEIMRQCQRPQIQSTDSVLDFRCRRFPESVL